MRNDVLRRMAGWLEIYAKRTLDLETTNIMSETKLEQNQRIILHKRRKEQLRQQQKLMDILSEDQPPQKVGWKGSDEVDVGYYYCPYVPLLKHPPKIIDTDTTA